VWLNRDSGGITGLVLLVLCVDGSSELGDAFVTSAKGDELLSVFHVCNFLNFLI
jgi:hypothetical protein